MFKMRVLLAVILISICAGATQAQILNPSFDSLQVSVLLLNPDSLDIEDANRAAVRFYGHSYDELTGMAIRDINVLPEPSIRALMDQAIASTQDYFLFTHRLADGSIRNVEVYSSPIEIQGRRYLLSIVHDISPRILTQTELAHARDRLLRAEEVARIGNWELDLASSIVRGSMGAATILGSFQRDWTRAEFVGFVEPEYRNKLRRTLQDLENAGGKITLEFPIHNSSSGQSVFVRLIAQRDANLQRIFGTVQDIGEELEIRKRLEEQTLIIFLGAGFLILVLSVGLILIFRQNQKLRAAQSTIQDLLKEKEVLLKEVHHRIKNHMNTAISLLTLQAGDVEHGADPEEILSAAASRLQTMMLIYDKLYRSESYEAISAREYLENLGDELAASLAPRKGGIQLRIQVADIQLPTKILLNLGMIANELITNAYKYAFPGENQGTITLSLEQQEERILLTVSDDGVGFRSEPESGGGFGLSLIRILNDQLQGDLSFESEGGVRVRVSAPLEWK